jgi:metallophosphoesterase superfamily enzyme
MIFAKRALNTRCSRIWQAIISLGPLRPLSLTQAYVAENVLLDARLGLFHEQEGWLAIADLHFGFELSQRLAGQLVPFWGMESSSARLLGLISDYQPRTLVILGDLVHDDAAVDPARKLLSDARKYCETITIAGNHDRKLRGAIDFVESFRTEAFEFCHGDGPRKNSGRIEIIGHFHPAATLRDGAGLHLKFPAFVQESTCWIMPAFSPWAAGTPWMELGQNRIWLCTPERILPLEPDESAV